MLRKSFFPINGANALRGALLTSSALFAAASAFAQAPAPAAPAEEPGLDDIVVTAQKREENLQKVPISVIAIGNEKLDQLQVSEFADFAKFLPSVAFQNVAPGFSGVYMRGVASGENRNHSGPLPSVGVYLDEQPITTIQGNLDIHVFDIARVESLAGPQGTLYGASSQAGTVRIISNKPDPNKFSGQTNIELNRIDGGREGYVLEGYVNAPINKKAAIRLVGWSKKDAGFIDNVASSRTFPGSGITIDNDGLTGADQNEVETFGARAALRVDLTSNWAVTPSVMFQEQETKGSFAYNPDLGDLQVEKFFPEGSTDNWYQAALTIEGRIGNFDVTYAGAYLKRDVDVTADYSDYSLAYDTIYQSYPSYYRDFFINDAGQLISPAQRIKGVDRYNRQTHEFRIASPADKRIRLVAGAFYQIQEHDIQQQYIVDGLAASSEVSFWPDTFWLTKQLRTDRDTALFGELTVDLTDKLKATGGIRAYKYRNSLKGFFGFGDTGFSSRTGEVACFSPERFLSGPCVNLDKEVEDEGTIGRVNLTYQIDDDKLVYATWSEGFRPGGINRRGTLPPFLADFLTNYEIGWKTSWGRQFRLNGAVFMETWEDIQLSFLGQNGLTDIRNAGDATIQGIEFDANWAPTSQLNFSGGATWLDATIDDPFCQALVNGQIVTDCANPQAPAGQELPVTPKFKASASGRYEFRLGDWDAFGQLLFQYTGSSWAELRTAEREALGELEAYASADFSIGAESGGTSLEFYVTNLTDERGDVVRLSQCAATICTGVTGLRYSVPTQPRTFGVKLGRKF